MTVFVVLENVCLPTATIYTCSTWAGTLSFNLANRPLNVAPSATRGQTVAGHPK